jgi:K+-transporting ATPase KdpF subunit
VHSTPVTANHSNPHHPMETIVIGIIALLLIGYLAVAMLYPEKF